MRVASVQLDGVGVANKPLSRGEASSSKNDDIEARLRQLHS